MFQNKKNNLIFLGAIVLSLFIGFKAGNWYNQYKIVPVEQYQEAENKTVINHNQEEEKQIEETGFTEEKKQVSQNKTNAAEIPAKVYEVLKYIRQNHEAPNGYVGGRVFSNREKVLPQFDQDHHKIRYQEWDVNPKIEGRNRGTERLVTSDEKAYYTNNHYQSFTEVNE